MKKFVSNWKSVFLGTLLLANFAVWYLVAAGSSGVLKVTFLDVGQGDAILIEAPGGNQLLLDGGPGRQILGALGQALPFYDRSLDLIVLSHADDDHVGGLPLVFERYSVGGLLESGVPGESSAYQTLLAESKMESAPRILATKGTRVDLGRGAILEILSPDRLISGADTNTASLVAKLSYGETSFLFTGDAPSAIEKYLVSIEGENLDVDVLKAGHHGSDTSNSEIFLAATTPDYFVISVGEGNRYGHPKAEVLERAGQAGAQILRTDKEGAVTLASDGSTITVR